MIVYLSGTFAGLEATLAALSFDLDFLVSATPTILSQDTMMSVTAMRQANQSLLQRW